MVARPLAPAALCLVGPVRAFADPAPVPAEAPGALCLPAIAAAERAERLPQHLLRSIAYVESGRADPQTGRTVPWPWTVNAGGTGTFYPTKEEAVAAVRQLQAGGTRSIDVGCAQVNLQHHPAAFASLDAAFDPATNALYAARFLNVLNRAAGSWPLAAAGYHSQTVDIGYGYARRVLAIWPGAARYGDLPPLPPAPGASPQQRGPDYSMYTPRLAALMRQMDEDRTRILGRIGGPAAPPHVALSLPPGSPSRPAALPASPRAGWRVAGGPAAAGSGLPQSRILEW